MTGRDEIRDAIRERQADVEADGALSMCCLSHFNASGHEVALHVISAKSAGTWGDADKIADLLYSVARRHAGGLVGSQQFQLSFCYGASGKASRPLPFLMAGASQIQGTHGLSTEPPTSSGMTQQAQRWGEMALQGATQKDLAVTQLMAGMIEELRDAYKDMFAESRELFLGLRRLSIETATAQQEQGLKLIMAKRNAALAHESFKMLPAALNGLTGKEIFPAATADTVHMKNIMRMFDRNSSRSTRAQPRRKDQRPRQRSRSW